MSTPNVLPPGYLFIALATMVLLNLFMPAHTVIPYPWNAIGLVPMALGLILNLIAGRAFIRNGNTIKAFETPQRLVTGGVYRFSRNPMYLGMTLILIGVAFLLGTLTPFIIVPVFTVVIEKVFIFSEENLLETRFGDEWKKYRRKVRRWL